ncbi:MAG: isoprenyl transferase [Longimicrobiales bacterium]
MADTAEISANLRTIRTNGHVPAHVAIIMDGNGRWAKGRGLPRFRGHTAGMASVRDVIEGAKEAGIEVLTLYTFSNENWNRPPAEVSALMRLLQTYIAREHEELMRKGVEVRVFGDIDRLKGGARKAVDMVQNVTRGGTGLKLNLMISYGSRAEIVRATQRLAERVKRGEIEASQIDDAMFSSELYTAGFPDPDLLIRTSGEMRISNFMLWQIAYTEMVITPVLWPDFRREQLFEAVIEYQGRDRRFGRVTAS